MQPDSIEEIFGPPVSVGRDANGEPTKALQGFAKKCGVEVSALQELTKADGAYFGFASREARPADRVAHARDRRRGAEGAADSQADALGRSRLHVRAARALARHAARRRGRRRRDSRAQVRPPFARPPLPSSAAGAHRRRRQLARRVARREGACRSCRAPRARARAKSPRRSSPTAPACRAFPMRCSTRSRT